MAGMSQPNVIWDGLKRGMLFWPYPDGSGFYHGEPLWIVAVLLILLGVAVLAVVLVSRPRREENP